MLGKLTWKRRLVLSDSIAKSAQYKVTIMFLPSSVHLVIVPINWILRQITWHSTTDSSFTHCLL